MNAGHAPADALPLRLEGVGCVYECLLCLVLSMFSLSVLCVCALSECV